MILSSPTKNKMTCAITAQPWAVSNGNQLLTWAQEMPNHQKKEQTAVNDSSLLLPLLIHLSIGHISFHFEYTCDRSNPLGIAIQIFEASGQRNSCFLLVLARKATLRFQILTLCPVFGQVPVISSHCISLQLVGTVTVCSHLIP